MNAHGKPICIPAPEEPASPDPATSLGPSCSIPVPSPGVSPENPPGLPGSSTVGTLLRGLCVTIFTVLSDSLLGRLVVSCSGITALGSGEEREGVDERRFGSAWTGNTSPPCPANPSWPAPREMQERWELQEQQGKAEMLQGLWEAASPP